MLCATRFELNCSLVHIHTRTFEFEFEFSSAYKMAAVETLGTIGGLSAFGSAPNTNFVAAPSATGSKGCATPICFSSASVRMLSAGTELLPSQALRPGTVIGNSSQSMISSGFVNINAGIVARYSVVAMPLAYSAPNLNGAFPLSALVPIYAPGTAQTPAALQAATPVGFGLDKDTVIVMQNAPRNGAVPVANVASTGITLSANNGDSPLVLGPSVPLADLATNYVLGYKGFDYTAPGAAPATAVYCVQITDASVYRTVPTGAGVGIAAGTPPIPGFYFYTGGTTTAPWPVVASTYTYRVQATQTYSAPST